MGMTLCCEVRARPFPRFKSVLKLKYQRECVYPFQSQLVIAAVCVCVCGNNDFCLILQIAFVLIITSEYPEVSISLPIWVRIVEQRVC